MKNKMKKGFTMIGALMTVSVMAIVAGAFAGSLKTGVELTRIETFKKEAYLLVDKVKEIKTKEGFIPYLSYTSEKNDSYLKIDEYYNVSIPYQILVSYSDTVILIKESEYGDDCFFLQMTDTFKERTLEFDSCRDTQPTIIH